jgi:hypothetical protein
MLGGGSRALAQTAASVDTTTSIMLVLVATIGLLLGLLAVFYTLLDISNGRHRGKKIAAAVATTVIGGGLVISVEILRRDNFVPPTPLISIPYRMDARYDEGYWRIREELTIDDQATTTLSNIETNQSEKCSVGSDRRVQSCSDELVDALISRGWAEGPSLDENQLLERSSVIAADVPRLRASNNVLAIQPNTFQLRNRTTLRWWPRDGSLAVVRAPIGMVGETFPKASQKNPTLADEQEQFTVPLDTDDPDLRIRPDGLEVRIAVLAKGLRSDAGHRLYAISRWPPIPYIVGSLVLALVWLLVERSKKRLLGEGTNKTKSESTQNPPH